MTKNIAASVRARLTNRAKETKRPFQEVLQHYGLERFLYRLASRCNWTSDSATSFIPNRSNEIIRCHHV